VSAQSKSIAGSWKVLHVLASAARYPRDLISHESGFFAEKSSGKPEDVDISSHGSGFSSGVKCMNTSKRISAMNRARCIPERASDTYRAKTSGERRCYRSAFNSEGTGSQILIKF
jgi:hypothetical protein